MDKVTLKQICKQLNVTASWVGKAITKLYLKKRGRGKRRIFTKDEFERIRNVRAMRACGISWAMIEQLRKVEESARMQIEKKYSLGIYKTGEKLYQMKFVLVEKAETEKEQASLVKMYNLSNGLKDIIQKEVKKNKEAFEDFLNTNYYTFQ